MRNRYLGWHLSPINPSLSALGGLGGGKGVSLGKAVCHDTSPCLGIQADRSSGRHRCTRGCTRGFNGYWLKMAIEIVDFPIEMMLVYDLKTYQKWILVGGWPTPLKNMSESQLGSFFPIYWKMKNVPNHQPGYHWDIIGRTKGIPALIKPLMVITIINPLIVINHHCFWWDTGF